ncbi:hypothetical protein V6Z05_09910 [Leptospira venezuelensis]|uniref:hypothetical protein n=1 Tax=Leptospira venezuelensis TaxID=1958811 RepID=UPI000A3CEC13|nr:hypothetical protein [Leptospira venezuelensis]
MFALVKNWENQKPKKPEPPWRLLGLGLLFVNGMAALFLPIGLFGTLISTIACLGFLFLPMFFMTLRLTKFYGNSIFFALFLGFISAPVSSLYLSHAFGFFLGLKSPEQTIFQKESGPSNSHIYRFTDSKFLYKYQVTKTTPGSIKKTLYFHVAPWVSSDWKEGDEVLTWAVCPQFSEKVCDWDKQNSRVGQSLAHSNIAGLSSYYAEAVQEACKKFGFDLPKSPRILLPISNPEEVLFNMGVLGLASLLALNYIWIIGILVWNKRRGV